MAFLQTLCIISYYLLELIMVFSSWNYHFSISTQTSIFLIKVLFSVWLSDEYSVDCDLLRHGSLTRFAASPSLPVFMMQTIFRAGIEADDDDDHGEDDDDSDEMRWGWLWRWQHRQFWERACEKRSNLIMPGKSSIQESLKLRKIG